MHSGIRHKKTSFDISKQAWYDDLAYGPESRESLSDRSAAPFYVVFYVQILAEYPSKVKLDS